MSRTMGKKMSCPKQRYNLKKDRTQWIIFVLLEKSH